MPLHCVRGVEGSVSTCKSNRNSITFSRHGFIEEHLLKQLKPSCMTLFMKGFPHPYLPCLVWKSGHQSNHELSISQTGAIKQHIYTLIITNYLDQVSVLSKGKTMHPAEGIAWALSIYTVLNPRFGKQRTSVICLNYLQWFVCLKSIHKFTCMYHI